MDLPPSGWYPDPYGTPALLRWWGGSAWTHHTHSDETAAVAGASAGSQASTGQSAGAQSAGAQPTRVQAAVEQTRVQAAWGQPAQGQQSQGQQAAVEQAAVEQTRVQRARIEPTTGALSRAEPPTGPPTSPQPALPDTGAGAGRAGAGAGADEGTRVLFIDADGWSTPGATPGRAPGGASGGAPGGPPRYGYGYAEARHRRRRRWLMGGLAAGTAVAVAVIAVIVIGLGSSPQAPAAATKPVKPAKPAAGASPTPSPSPSVSVPIVTLTDRVSGLSYTQLTTPWQADCPSTLNNGAFTWTSGESAIAGQVNGGQTTWYGEACSGPLPAQYGYTGVAALESTATNLVNTFQGAYYSALDHTATPEVSQPVTISGHAGWEVTFAITYTNAQAQGVTWADEQAAVVIIDSGTAAAPAVFFTSIPASLGESNVTTLVSSLQLSVAPPPTATPAGTGTPAGTASGAASATATGSATPTGTATATGTPTPGGTPTGANP